MARDNELQKQRQKEWYLQNKELVKQRQRDQRASIRKWLLDYKQRHGCNKCSQRHPAALDFHHLDENKEFEIADAVMHKWAIARIEAEVAKCQVLCANCHRILHFENGSRGKLPYE
jgi:hypothetical protein